MAVRLALYLLQLYQRYVRSFLPASCRFQPCCSDYAKEAISRYGLLSGGLKAMKRLFSCQPFSGKSGYDPLI